MISPRVMLTQRGFAVYSVWKLFMILLIIINHKFGPCVYKKKELPESTSFLILFSTFITPFFVSGQKYNLSSIVVMFILLSLRIPPPPSLSPSLSLSLFLSLVLSVLISVSVFSFLQRVALFKYTIEMKFVGFSRPLSRTKTISLDMLLLSCAFKMRIGSPERPSIGVFVM